MPTIGYSSVEDLEQARESISREKRKVLLFCHMHKTGGSTIERVLLEHFGETAHRISTLNQLTEFKQKVRDGLLDEENTYLVFGHRAHVALDFLKDSLPTFPFTIVRRPLPLFESNYSFQHTRQGNTTLTTKDYLTQYPNNRITDFFGAKGFEKAVRNIHRDYLVVGLTERLEEFASVLSYLFSLPARTYQSKNVTKAGNYVEMDFSLVNSFLKDNNKDRLLYDYLDALHTRTYRQLLKVSDTPIIAIETDQSTFNTPIQVNTELETNNDKFSLFVTGQSIWKDDPDKAIAFFDKSFAVDWGMANRIMKFLNNTDSVAATKWAKRKEQELGSDDSDEVVLMRKRLIKLFAD